MDFETNSNYETLSGYILFHHETIPRTNDIIFIKNYIIKILKADKNKIDKVKITKQSKTFKIP